MSADVIPPPETPSTNLPDIIRTLGFETFAQVLANQTSKTETPDNALCGDAGHLSEWYVQLWLERLWHSGTC